jgi:hypothetical protein
MTTKSPQTRRNIEEQFPIVATLSQRARELVRKRPGIYKGNLIYWLQKQNPDATRIHIELAFNQLLRQGFFFSYEDTFHPPNTVSEEVKLLTKFISKHRPQFTDYGILYELNRRGGFSIGNHRRFAREVISKGWSEDEFEVKGRIHDLIQRGIITEDRHGFKVVNWEYIMEAIG